MGFVIDAHSDLLCDVYPLRLMERKAVLEQKWIPRMRAGGIDLRVSVIYISDDSVPERALRVALGHVAALHQDLQESPSAVLCTSYEEMIAAKENGRVGFILGMEGVEPLGNDLELLPIFHLLGLRILGLVHARRNYAADGAFFDPQKTGRVGGLSSFGVALVERAQQLNMLVDVSHLNDPGFWDVLENSSKPVIASHSNCRALHNHPRNLTDDQIRALADRGGVIGANAAGLIVGHDSLDAFLDHIDHLIQVGGREQVGLGLDFCDYLVEYRSPVENHKHPHSSGPVAGLAGDEDVPKIAVELSRRGHSDDQIERIMGGNFLRVFQEVIQ